MKVPCKHNSLILASLYRPTKNDSDYASRLASAMESLVKMHPKGIVLTGGDAKLPDIDWSTNNIRGNSYRKDITLLQAMNNCGFDQVVDFHIREDNLLDVFLTNRYLVLVTLRKFISNLK